MAMEYKIIAGFPGVGKSYAGKSLKDGGKLYNGNVCVDDIVVVDMESSEYHWIMNGDEKICNPEWPDNYITEILRVCHNSTDDRLWIPLISTHKIVIERLISKIKEMNPIEYTEPLKPTELNDLLDEEIFATKDSEDIPSPSKEFYDLFIVAPYPNDECKKKFINRYIERGSSDEFVKSLDENYYSYLKDLESFAYDAKIYFIDGYMSDFIELIVLDYGCYFVDPDIYSRAAYSGGDNTIPMTSDTFNFEYLFRRKYHVARDISLINKESIE